MTFPISFLKEGKEHCSALLYIMKVCEDDLESFMFSSFLSTSTPQSCRHGLIDLQLQMLYSLLPADYGKCQSHSLVLSQNGLIFSHPTIWPKEHYCRETLHWLYFWVWDFNSVTHSHASDEMIAWNEFFWLLVAYMFGSFSWWRQGFTPLMTLCQVSYLISIY